MTSYRLNTPPPNNIQNIHLYHLLPIKQHPSTVYKTYIYITLYLLSTQTIYKTYIYITSYRLKHPNNIQNIHLYHLVPIKHPQQYTKHTYISPRTDSTPPTIYKTYIYITLYLLNTQTIYKTYIYITLYRLNTPNNIQNIHLYHTD